MNSEVFPSLTIWTVVLFCTILNLAILEILSVAILTKLAQLYHLNRPRPQNYRVTYLKEKMGFKKACSYNIK